MLAIRRWPTGDFLEYTTTAAILGPCQQVISRKTCKECPQRGFKPSRTCGNGRNHLKWSMQVEGELEGANRHLNV